MSSCTKCGTPAESRNKIDQLENEVKVLTQQSVDALNRLAGYEDEIRQLRMQRTTATASTTIPAPSAATATASTTAPSTAPADTQHNHNTSVDSAASAGGYGLNRFAGFRMGRKTSVAAVSSVTSNPSVDLGDLQSQLAKEQAARADAEKKAAQLNSELEDLSVNLFEQANQMVATERKARSKLEERIATLEKRDKDKSRRLEKIENALHRLERVRALLGPPSPPI